MSQLQQIGIYLIATVILSLFLIVAALALSTTEVTQQAIQFQAHTADQVKDFILSTLPNNWRFA